MDTEARSRSPEDDGEGSGVDDNEAKKQANREWSVSPYQ